MDGWMDGWMNRWIYVDACIDWWNIGQIYGWMQ